MQKDNIIKTGVLPKKREVWIDQIRGFAMFLVLISHSETHVMFETYVFLMMPLFFFISGYLHRNTAKPDWAKLSHRIVYRIGTPYLFFATLFLFEEYLRTRNAIQFHNYFIDIITGRTFWFLPTLVAVELYSVSLDYIICKGSEKLRKSKFFMKFTGIIIGFLSMYIVKKHSGCPYYLDTAVTALTFYYLGNLVKDIRMLELKSVYRYVPFIIFTLFLFLSRTALENGITFNMSTNDNDHPIITCMLAFIGTMSVFFGFKSINLGSIWAMLGRNTMLVYGINLYALCLGRMVADRLPFAPDGGYIWTITEVLIAVVICLLCSYPVNRWFPIIVGNKK